MPRKVDVFTVADALTLRVFVEEHPNTVVRIQGLPHAWHSACLQNTAHFSKLIEFHDKNKARVDKAGFLSISGDFRVYRNAQDAFSLTRDIAIARCRACGKDLE